MPRTMYQLGADKERRIVNKARAQGCLAFRSAGSHSPIDVFVLDKTTMTIHLIQSKGKSMSDKAKQKLYETLEYLEGKYMVVVRVE